MRSFLLFCVLLPGCTLFQRPPRPVHAPPQEAARFAFPETLPTEGRQLLSGTLFAAIQLAMEDFRPWDTNPHKGATPGEICLYKRDSYDVSVVSGAEELVYVDISPRPGACEMGGPPVMGFDAVYAIDVKNWRIIAVQR
ncbi:hypothetical protein POL68_16405 [Stigmatella sp. ncwal1]|uniref:Lipoprotein n=1 Tax=Stigmatella ashevillensis TaxID=2995309 RepID=A0ABT5D8V7_9BACT|nr:hypothetical protein [Stigmatella ashevillena]